MTPPAPAEAPSDAALERIAATAGTPVYVYDAGRIRAQYAHLARALAPVPHRIHYSVKANANHAVLSLLRELGAGVDIVSGGELYRALRAGFRGQDVVFSGVGKTEQELDAAVACGVLLVNAESEGELHALNDAAARAQRRVAVALRVNPEVTVDTPHPYTRTGERGMKFGIPYDDIEHVARIALALPHLELAGLDMHLGSQVARPEVYETGLRRLLELLPLLRRAGATALRYVDVGGGFAISYAGERALDPAQVAAALLPLLREARLTVIVEPGRYLVGAAGTLLTRVLYRKRSGGREFVITDAGMTDLVRPALYDAYHGVRVVAGALADTPCITADVVGPVCESGDFLAMGREIPDVAAGALLAVECAGAYGSAMSSNYNSRPRAAEVMVDGDRFAVVTRRERYEDLVERETDQPEWQPW
ncbi:MAG TPA: diaminopimelate decarboxylase [Gemmatimonadaceae bacterium]|nr:diaminopimelate decarboxylase [Gemmatimonadaceae bacterium]